MNEKNEDLKTDYIFNENEKTEKITDPQKDNEEKKEDVEIEEIDEISTKVNHMNINKNLIQIGKTKNKSSLQDNFKAFMKTRMVKIN